MFEDTNYTPIHKMSWWRSWALTLNQRVHKKNLIIQKKDEEINKLEEIVSERNLEIATLKSLLNR